jgi:endonuclease/exonuclease/phosphatase family metal-dependent hydrolase
MNNQDRTWVAQVMLKDTVASKLVDVESVHLDTSVTNTCAKQNWTDLLQKNMTLNGFSGALHIIGGDFNIYDVADPNNLSAGMKSWWNTATINYKDAINDFCATTTNRLDCDANQNWTSKAGHHRIDFIFAQRSDGTKPTMPYRFTIPFTENASSYTYSDHQAITALINY